MDKEQPHKIPPPNVEFVKGANYDDLTKIEKDYLETLKAFIVILQRQQIISGLSIVVGKTEPDSDSNGSESLTVFGVTTSLNPFLANIGAQFKIGKLKPEAIKAGWKGFEFKVLSQELYLPPYNQ